MEILRLTYSLFFCLFHFSFEFSGEPTTVKVGIEVVYIGNFQESDMVKSLVTFSSNFLVLFTSYHTEIFASSRLARRTLRVTVSSSSVLVVVIVVAF